MEQLVEQFVISAGGKGFLAEQIFRSDGLGEEVFDRPVGVGDRRMIGFQFDLGIVMDPAGDLRSGQEQVQDRIRFPILHDVHSPMILISTRLRRPPSNSP